MADQTKKSLILLDDLGSDWLKTLGDRDHKNEELYLLTFNFSPEQAFLKSGGSPTKTVNKIQNVEIKDFASKAEKLARDYYVGLINDFPQRDISTEKVSDILNMNDRNLWWYLDISEKSIWRDKTVHRLYALLCLVYACERIGYDELHLCIKDATLKRSIIAFAGSRGMRMIDGSPDRGREKLRKGPIWFSILYFYANLRVFIKTLLQVLLIKTLKSKHDHKVQENAVGIFSLFPHWWEKPFSRDAVELFFRDFPKELAKTKEVLYLIWIDSTRKPPFKQFKGLQNFIKSQKTVILQGYLRVSDLFSVFKMDRFFAFKRLFNGFMKMSFQFEGLDVSDIIRETLCLSLLSPVVPEWLLLDQAFQRLPLDNYEAIFFRLEFQPLERSLLYNTRHKTLTFGFQHSALGPNFLNYVFPMGELGGYWENRDNAQNMPLPDFILVSGKLGFDYLAKAGYPAERLFICGGLRYTSLFEYKRNQMPKVTLKNKYHLPLNKRIIFTPTSQILNETLCMFGDLLCAIQQMDQPFHLIIKSNPNKDSEPEYLSRILDFIRGHAAGTTYEIYNGKKSFYDCICASDALLLTGGTSALEAIALGVVPIIYNCASQFSHNPMLQYPQAVLVADNSETMLRALRAINDNESSREFSKFWREPLMDMFGDLEYDPNRRILDYYKVKGCRAR